MAVSSILNWGLVAAIAAGLAAPADNLAQSASPGSRTDAILEVTGTVTGWGGDNRYVYLRVLSDGTAECEPVRHEVPIIKKTLSPTQFTRIKAVLSQRNVARLGDKYETNFATVDDGSYWTIEIQRPIQPQFIRVVGFTPGLAKILKHPYPGGLVTLGCSIEKLRTVVTGEPNLPHSECAPVLGTTLQ